MHPKEPLPESHRLWNNRHAFWFHRLSRLVQLVSAERLRPAALIYNRPIRRVLEAGSWEEWVRSASETVKNPKGKSGTERPGRAVGDALREAYDEAVSEGIPDDMLDLLKKLD